MEFIKGLLLIGSIILAVYLLYGRRFMLSLKHKKLQPIELPESVTNVIELKKFLEDNKFSYPDLKDIVANGKVLYIYGKFENIITLENDGILVNSYVPGSERKLDESFALHMYLEKFFNPEAFGNPYGRYKKINKMFMTRIAIIVSIFVMMGVIGLLESGVLEKTASGGIYDAYLTQFSEKYTVGEVFEDFFSDTEWRTYKQGPYTYVDFNGYCIDQTNNQPMPVKISFSLNNNGTFNVEEMKVDGTIASDFDTVILIQSIYDSYLE